jgi:hypothetical protein
MATVVAKTGVRREKGWLYYLDKKGNVSRARMARGGGRKPKGRPELVTKAGVKREEGFLYFIDKKGNVARVKMARAGGRKARRSGRRPARRARAGRRTARRRS